MRGANVATMLRDVRQLFESGSVAGLSDQELLDRFLARQDAIALEAIIRRHGPAVLAVCRAILRDPEAADDAFQATFLVLVRKAATIRVQGSLGPWLYGVSRRVAIRAARALAKCQLREVPMSSEFSSRVERDELEDREIAGVLHAEIARLPHSYRVPLLAHYFEGLTHEEAAQRLRCPLGTIKGRLARARRILRDRLARRGLGVTAGLLATALTSEARSATIPVALRDSTLKLAVASCSSRSALAAGTIPAALLAQGTMNAMFVTKIITTVSALLLSAALVGTGAKFTLKSGDEAEAKGTVVAAQDGAAAQRAQAKDDADLVAARAEQLGREFERLRGLAQLSHDGLKNIEVRLTQLTQERADELKRLEQIVSDGKKIEEQLREVRALHDTLSLRGPKAAVNDPNKTYPVVYAIGDLIGSDQRDAKQDQTASYDPLIELIKASVASGTWKDAGDAGDSKPDASGRIGSITPFFPKSSLIIRHTAAVHKQITERLRQLRRLRGLREPSETRLGDPVPLSRDLADVTTKLPETALGTKRSADITKTVDYIVCEGDTILIRCKNYTRTSVVGKKGTAKFGEYGEVYVEGLGLREAREKLLTHLRSAWRDEKIVLDSSSPSESSQGDSAGVSKLRIWVSSGNRFAHVRGAVVSPGKVPVGLSVLDAIKKVGGLKPGIPLDSLAVELLRVDIEGRINDAHQIDLTKLNEKSDILVMSAGDILDVKLPVELKTSEPRPAQPISNDTNISAPPTPKASRPQEPIDDKYIVEPPDVLIVSVPKAKPERPIDGERLVRPDGTITLGDYGDVFVGGLSLRDVKAKIVTHLRQHLSDEILGLDNTGTEHARGVDVRIGTVNSKVFYVAGGGRTMRRYSVTGDLTVRDAIRLDSGLSKAAQLGSNALIRRNTKDKDAPELLHLDLAAIRSERDMSTNYQILAGDGVLISSTKAPGLARTSALSTPPPVAEPTSEQYVTRKYKVTDLIPKRVTSISDRSSFSEDEMRRMSDLITSAIAPTTWAVELNWIDKDGKRCGFVKPNPSDGSLEIVHSVETHQKITEFLATLRRLRGTP